MSRAIVVHMRICYRILPVPRCCAADIFRAVVELPLTLERSLVARPSTVNCHFKRAGAGACTHDVPHCLWTPHCNPAFPLNRNGVAMAHTTSHIACASELFSANTYAVLYCTVSTIIPPTYRNVPLTTPFLALLLMFDRPLPFPFTRPYRLTLLRSLKYYDYLNLIVI